MRPLMLDAALNAELIDATPAWEAELNLGFAKRGDKTLLVRRAHYGPLMVQRPFYPEGGISHVYLLHPPGGVVAGDCLHIEVSVAEQAQALLTTPAAGKFYCSNGREAKQSVSLNVEAGGTLEWLPQESIVFQGAKLNSSMDINLAEDTGLIAWEMLVMGRPAAGEGFESGHAALRWRITHAKRLLYLERMHLDVQAFKARWGLAEHSACGALFAFPANVGQLAAVQALIAEHPSRGVTLIGDLLICRAIDQRADRLRCFFEEVWHLLRQQIVGQNACAPRIWAT